MTWSLGINRYDDKGTQRQPIKEYILAVMAKTPPPKKPSAVIDKIREEAQKQGFTAYSLAKETGLSINAIQRMLDGTTAPSITSVERVAAALGFEITISKQRK